MKNNLKEKIKEQNKIKAKVVDVERLESANFEDEDNKVSFADIWKEEIEKLKSREFSTLRDVKDYIIQVISNKEGLTDSKEFNDFANLILEGNPQIDDVLERFVRK